MTQARGIHDENSGNRILAYTDTHLCYCPTCACRLGYDAKGRWEPNWLPFIVVCDSDDVPQKHCDACGKPFASG
jgi:hypothetical protein